MSYLYKIRGQMDFFEGFKWAMPKVFSDAIANIRFDEGDIIYNSKSAYQEWEKALEATNYYIKIKYPKRTSRSLTSKNKSVQRKNWKSKAIAELANIKRKTKQQIETTQGALFSLFWKGDLSILESGKQIDPPYFLKNIKEKQNTMLKEVIPKCKEIASGRPFFVMAHDLTNNVSRDKYQSLSDSLKSILKSEPILLNPKEAGYQKWNKIFPVIKTVLFIFKIDDVIYIENILKKALYRPTKGAKRSAFKLETHGVFFKEY